MDDRSPDAAALIRSHHGNCTARCRRPPKWPTSASTSARTRFATASPRTARTGRRHPSHPGAARTQQARHNCALHQGLGSDDPSDRRAARPADGTDGGQVAAQLSRACLDRGTRHLTRSRACLPGRPFRSLEPHPAQGHVGDRELAAPRPLAVTSKLARTAASGGSPTTPALWANPVMGSWRVDIDIFR